MLKTNHSPPGLHGAQHRANGKLKLTAEQVKQLQAGKAVLRATIDYMPDADAASNLEEGLLVQCGVDSDHMMTGAGDVKLTVVTTDDDRPAATLDELLKHDPVHNMGAEPIEPIAPDGHTLHLDMGKPDKAHQTLRERLDKLAGMRHVDALAQGGSFSGRLDDLLKTGDSPDAGAGSNEGGVLCRHDVEHLSALHQAIAATVSSVHSTELRQRLQDTFMALPSADRHGLSYADARAAERDAEHRAEVTKSRQDGFVSGLDVVCGTVALAALAGMPTRRLANMVIGATERFKEKRAAEGSGG